jgi:putative ABC transport system permease protein
MRFIFWKTVIREIHGSLGRFLAIVGIVALGAGCLTGLQSSGDAMLHTAQQYIDSRRLYDFRLISSLGFEQAQVDSVAGIEGVRDAEGSLSLDVLCSSGQEADYVLRVLSINDQVNLPDLKEGRMPKNGRECLGDALIFSSESIGQTVKISEDNSQDVKDRLLYGEYTIVGLATSPLYLNFERGTTSLGNGSVAGFLYIPFEGLDAGTFTDICLTLQSGGPIYSAVYEEVIDGMKDSVTAACEQQANLRYEALVSSSRAEIDDGEKEYNDSLETYKREKADADQELADGLNKLLDTKTELADGGRKLMTAGRNSRRRPPPVVRSFMTPNRSLPTPRPSWTTGRPNITTGWPNCGTARKNTTKV